MAVHKRPLSPHLQVYRPQLTSILSITHRITGIVLSVGALVLVYWLTAVAAGPEAYQQAQGLLSSPLGLVALFIWNLALFYHLGNGLRHLFWDAGCGLNIKAAYTSGKAVVVFALVLTALAWLLAAFM